MAQSRFSMPFFAIFLVAIAVYMAYLIATKNIFNAASVNHSAPVPSVLVEDSEHESANQDAHDLFFDAKKLKKIITSTTKKIFMNPESHQKLKPVNPAPKNIPAASEGVGGKAIAPTDVSAGSLAVPKALSAQQMREYELKILWEKYSATVPRLYSRPLSADTEEKLARVGQLSMSLDLLYPQDRGSWMLRVDDAREELIAIAVAGEREGARALSFQYFRPPHHKALESLTWAMIANAIAPIEVF